MRQSCEQVDWIFLGVAFGTSVKQFDSSLVKLYSLMMSNYSLEKANMEK